MAKRDYPNDYYAWFNDDNRLAIVERKTSSDTTKGIDIGEYDTYNGTGNLSGTISDADCSGTTITFTTSAVHGLATGDTVSISGTDSFNDDNLASQSVTVTSTTAFTMTRSSSSSNTNETGTFTSLFVDNGIRITIHSKYETASNLTDDLESTCGLNEIMHINVLEYVKSRILEDMGDMEKSRYFREKYERGVQKKSTRKSGVRVLLVPEL
jgi:hypothetical protein